MITIRNNTYAIYKGNEYRIHSKREDRNEGLDNEEFILSTSDESLISEEFIKSNHTAEHYIIVSRKDLTNAFCVETHGFYRGKKIKIFKFSVTPPEILTIGTSEEALATALDMVKVRENWFLKDIPLEELDSITEVYSPVFGFDVPESLKGN